MSYYICLIFGRFVDRCGVSGFIVRFVAWCGINLSLIGLRVDIVINLHVSLAGELGVPETGGVIAVTGLVLAVVKSLSVAILAVSVLCVTSVALSGHIPVKLVIRDVL